MGLPPTVELNCRYTCKWEPIPAALTQPPGHSATREVPLPIRRHIEVRNEAEKNPWSPIDRDTLYGILV